MANQFKLTSKVATNSLLALLKNNLVFGRNVGTRYSQYFGKKVDSIGDTVAVRRSQEFIASDGAAFVNQDVVTGSSSITINKQKHIGITWQPTDKPLKVDDLLEDSVLKAKMAQLAQQIESDIADLMIEFPSWVGSPGAVVNSSADFFQAPQRLDEFAVPGDGRVAMMPPADFYATAASFATPTFFGNSINDKALTNVRLPMIGNIQPYMVQTAVSFTTGTRVADAGAVAGAAQSVNYSDVKDTYTQTIDLDGFGAAATFKRGDTFTIAGVYAVNPRTKAPLPYLQQFVVLADATASGAGAVTLTIANPIIAATGADEALRTNTAFQTVDSVPADDAAVVFLGAPSTVFTMCVAYNKEAVQIAFVKPTRPNTGDFAYSTDPETGISIRTWEYSDGDSDTHKTRCDIIYGITMHDRRLGTRYSGAA